MTPEAEESLLLAHVSGTELRQVARAVDIPQLLAPAGGEYGRPRLATTMGSGRRPPHRVTTPPGGTFGVEPADLEAKSMRVVSCSQAQLM
jgi:hypothetical protein